MGRAALVLCQPLTEAQVGDGNRDAKKHADFMHQLFADEVEAVDRIPLHRINDDPYAEELVVTGAAASVKEMRD